MLKPRYHFLSTQLFAAVAWCFVVFLVFKAAALASFGGDDAHLIQLASSVPFWHFFINPEANQLLSVAHFTPLVPGLYQGVLWLAGVNPTAFLVFQLVMLGLTLGGLLWLLQQNTKSSLAGWVFCLALAAAGSLPSLLLRNYTQHYVLGGLFAVICLLALHQRWFMLSLISFLLAIISKEIYLPLFGFIVLYALYKRHFSLLGGTLVVLVAYFALRGWHLGASIQGRNGTGLLADLLAVQVNQWLAFVRWYVSFHAGLLLLALLALVVSPLRFLLYAGLAAMFLTPLLAAPHAILNPEFHADRLLYPFNLGLAFAIALAFGQTTSAKGWLLGGWFSNSRLILLLPLVMAALLLRLIFLPLGFPAFEAQERQRVQQLLNQLNTTFASQNFASPALANPKPPLTFLVPLNFKMGALIDAYKTFKPEVWQATPVALSFNCFTVLQQAGKRLPVVEFWQPHLQVGFQGETGKGWVARNALEKECQPLAKGEELLQINKPMTFGIDGSLSWQAELTKPVDEAALQAGIYFTERALFIGTLGFNERLVRPYPNEEYQWVIKHGNAWWFSERNGVRVE